MKSVKTRAELTLLEDLTPSKSSVIQKFVDIPTVTNWVELVTGLASSDKGSLISASGRIGQGALKGKLFQQLGKEMLELKKKGMIKDDYLESELGRSSFVDMLKFIDEENPDEIRFKAMRYIFFSSVAMDYDETKRRRAYYLFQEAKPLSSMDIQVLNACYKIYLKNDVNLNSVGDTGNWVGAVNEEIGLNLVILVDKADKHLSELGFISQRKMSDGSAVDRGRNFRLTESLGLPFCELIQEFDSMLKEKSNL